MVKAITVPEVVLEFVSEFNSKEESCNNQKNNFNNHLILYLENCKKEISKGPNISELKDYQTRGILLVPKFQEVKIYIWKIQSLDGHYSLAILNENWNSTIHRARKRSIATTLQLPSLFWSSLAPTLVNMHPRRTIIYCGWLLLTTVWRERRLSLGPPCWIHYDLCAFTILMARRMIPETMFLPSCHFRLRIIPRVFPPIGKKCVCSLFLIVLITNVSLLAFIHIVIQ